MKSLKVLKRDIYLVLIYRLAILLFIYALLRLGFYFNNISLFPSVTAEKLGVMMLGGMKFDLVALLYLNSLFLLLQVIPFRFRYNLIYQKVSKWIFLVTNALGIALNLIDFAYYRFTLKRTTGTVFEQFSNEENKFKLALDFLWDYWYLLILFLISLYLLSWLYNRVSIKPPKNFNYVKYISHSLAFIFIIGLTIIGIRGGWRHSTRPITLSNAGLYVDKPEEMYIVLNTPFSIIRTIGSVQLKPVHYFNEKELESIYNPIHVPQPDSAFKPLNVVFLIIESLGKEHIGALNKTLDNGNYKGYTPFLDSLIGESFTFTQTFANGRKSIDALPSIISGIPSIEEPFVLSVYSGNETNSVAQLLKKKGYETAFFHGAPNGSMGFSAYTKLAGIDNYFGKTEYNNDADFDGIWGIWDEPFMQFMAQKLNTFKEPFFSTFFSLSSHHPFKVPEKYIGKFPKGPLPVQEPVGYTDMAIRRFFETASTMPWFKNTLFVLCADHATVSYFPEYQTVAGAYSIPIVFYYPGGYLKGIKDHLVQQIDIVPTVLNFLNYDQPYFAFGFDAFKKDTTNFVINNNGSSFNFYQGDYLLLSDGNTSTQLFDVKKDKFLKNNIVNTLPEVQSSMEEHLKAFIQQYNNRMIANELTAK